MKNTQFECLKSSLAKVAGLTLLLTALLSIDFFNLTSSSRPSLTLIFVALIDTILLSYVAAASTWKGWKLWFAVFLGFYGIRYVLTAMESVYLSSVLNTSAVIRLFINGAIVSALFSAILIRVLGKGGNGSLSSPRLVMHPREWAWKIAISGIVYLILFILFGVMVYYPLAGRLDPSSLAIEQGSIDRASAVWVLPFEAIRGMVWVIITVPVILAVSLGKNKTAFLIGLLFSLPMLDIFLSPNIAPGLQVAHFFELFGENLLFGVCTVWILGSRSRLL